MHSAVTLESQSIGNTCTPFAQTVIGIVVKSKTIVMSLFKNKTKQVVLYTINEISAFYQNSKKQHFPYLPEDCAYYCVNVSLKSVLQTIADFFSLQEYASQHTVGELMKTVPLMKAFQLFLFHATPFPCSCLILSKETPQSESLNLPR